MNDAMVDNCNCSTGIYVCVCVCSSHYPIGPQPYDHLEKQNAVADPVRGLLDRREKGNKPKEAAPGYKLQKRKQKQFPQKTKSEISNIQSSGKNTKQQESKRDDNRHERTIENGGQVETLHSLWSATHNGEAITLGIGVRGRQKAKQGCVL